MTALAKRYDVVSFGELVVEIFRMDRKAAFHQVGELMGPFPSGASAICIDTLGKLGARTAFFGPLGDDPFGHAICERLRRDGVDVHPFFCDPETRTGLAFTRYNADGTREFVYYIRNEAPSLFSPDQLDFELLISAEWLHISGNLLTFSDSAREACWKAANVVSEAGGKISFDPNLRAEMADRAQMAELCKPFLPLLTLALPSETEAATMTGIEDEDRACRHLLDAGIELVVRKQGTNGCTLYQSGEKEVHIPGFVVEEVDPTGAGDSFAAGFLFGLLQGWPPPKCGRFANATGALAVTRLGAMEGIRSREQVETLLAPSN